MSPTFVVAYLALFATVGFLFIFACLLVGRFLRARAPTAEKAETYECGEPAVGSSFVRFDMRFYVVALLFIIFDVGIALLFPWATVFGKAVQLTDLHQRAQAMDQRIEDLCGRIEGTLESGNDWSELREAESRRATLAKAAARKYRELGEIRLGVDSPTARSDPSRQTGVRSLAVAAVFDMGMFFAVLLVAFAYVWRRGDLDWVRPACRRQARAGQRPEGPREA